jgi:hypothetical protein
LVESGSASSSSIAAALTEYAFSRPERPIESANVVRGVIEPSLAANREPEQIRKRGRRRHLDDEGARRGHRAGHPAQALIDPDRSRRPAPTGAGAMNRDEIKRSLAIAVMTWPDLRVPDDDTGYEVMVDVWAKPGWFGDLDSVAFLSGVKDLIGQGKLYPPSVPELRTAVIRAGEPDTAAPLNEAWAELTTAPGAPSPDCHR